MTIEAKPSGLAERNRALLIGIGCGTSGRTKQEYIGMSKVQQSGPNSARRSGATWASPSQFV